MKLRAAKTKPRAYHQSARAEAAEALGQSIIDAFLARLMTQWFDEITLDSVAADAGTTVQTIVRRFGGKDGLLADSIKTLGTRINTQRETPGGDLGRIIDNLVCDYEVTGDAVIRLLALEERQPALKAFTDLGRNEHRGWIERVLDQALAKLDAQTRKSAMDALVICTDVYTWKLLRRDMRRSVNATKTMIGRLVQATITEFSNSKS